MWGLRGESSLTPSILEFFCRSAEMVNGASLSTIIQLNLCQELTHILALENDFLATLLFVKGNSMLVGEHRYFRKFAHIINHLHE